VVTLAGSGVNAHSVDLTWTASTSTVSGYNVYRREQSQTSYTSKLNSSLVAGTTYTDSTVEAGKAYFYVARAVDSNGVESVNSNEAQAVVPFP
jgi:fibronectin type 3 domain-containing protein